MKDVLLHGTTLAAAHAIMTVGFKRASDPSYTGTGINLTPDITTAYDYGPYEKEGCIMQVTLKDDAIVLNRNTLNSLSDDFFTDNPGADAVSICHGNVVIVWNTDIIESVTILDEKNAIRQLEKCFNDNGLDMAYNGYTMDRFDQWLAKNGLVEVYYGTAHGTQWH